MTGFDIEPGAASTVSTAVPGTSGGSAENVVTYPGIQLDPSTRTGWTFGADGTEVEQFRY